MGIPLGRCGRIVLIVADEFVALCFVISGKCIR